MDSFSALIFGIVQGLTEFLPVSSTAHLIIVPQWLCLPEPTVAFDVMLHLGTLLAVLVFFWKDIVSMLTRTPRLLGLLMIATVPTGILGICFKGFFESFFESNLWIGVFLMITGCLLWFAERAGSKNEKGLKEMTWKDALVIGTMQGVAILPGISRSGSTVATSLFRGLNREFAATFSFLLSVPAILGAALLKAKEIQSLPLKTSLIGLVASFVMGVLAIKIFVTLIKKKGIRIFSWYCWILGAIMIFFSLTSF